MEPMITPQQNTPSIPASPPRATSATNPLPAPKRESSIGPIIGIIIVIAVLLVGALYFWGQHLSKVDLQEGKPNEQPNEEMSQVPPVSDSDELSTIEAELSATAIESFDWVFEEIDGELSPPAQ